MDYKFFLIDKAYLFDNGLPCIRCIFWNGKRIFCVLQKLVNGNLIYNLGMTKSASVSVQERQLLSETHCFEKVASNVAYIYTQY